MFTAYFLQEALIKELKKLFEEQRFPDRTGEMTEINVFEQFLPILDVEDGGETQENLEGGLFGNVEEKMPAPYIQVILTGGKTSTVNQPSVVNVLLYMCIYDEGKLRNGYQYILNMIQKILERFQKDSMLDGYRCDKEIQWEIGDTDDHPFYFGAMAMDFEVAMIGKESDYC